MAASRRTGSSPSTPALYAWIHARCWTRDDRASSSLVSFIIGAAVFLVGSTYLLGFAMHPPGAGDDNLVSQDLRSTGDKAMQVLLGSSGYPSSWSSSSASIDGVKRLGLLLPGSTSRIDPAAFDALAHGSSGTASGSNGYVDYDEAKAALGLASTDGRPGYEFHLRASPVISASAVGSYGVLGMEDYRVAYVGAYAGGSPTSAANGESATLDALPIAYSGVAAPTGDLYQDDSTFLRNNLVSHLGVSVAQTTIANGGGSDKYDFAIVPAGNHSTWSGEPSASRALALNLSGTGLGYTKGREMRGVVGTANFSAIALSTTIRWSEFVDTSNDTGDFGFVELSPDGGATWYPITNSAGAQSTDTWSHVGGRWVSRTATVSSLSCSSCMGANAVLVAFHWVADSDTQTGRGWVVDDVSIDSSGFDQTFEKPDYDMLVVGSNVAQNALTADQVKSAISDFVNVYGGRLMVLGGEQNVQWLEPLMHVGISSTSSQVATPDTTHPLLSVPNELDWSSYSSNNKVWDFSGGADQNLFTGVVQTSSGQDILAVSNAGAFGAYGEAGSVMLTTYLPYSMSSEQMSRFFANALVYGKYRALYFDLGPTVPTDVPVSTLTRSATVDMTNDDSGVYTEISLTMYVWQGSSSTTSSSTTTTAVSGPPRFNNVTPHNAYIVLNWTWPTSNGTGTINNYTIYRGTSTGAETYYRVAQSTWFTFNDTNVTNGVTYYYNLSANGTKGNSTSSIELSATPSTIPGAPTGLVATPGISLVTLAWSAPASNGGSALTNYSVYRGTSQNGAKTHLADVVATCMTFTDLNLGGLSSYYYNVSALNANGEGPLSSATNGASATVPSATVATASANANTHNSTVSWTLVADPTGAPVTGYHVYAANASGAEALVANVSAATSSYQESGFTNGTIRYYKVAAYNDVGEASLSTETFAAFVGLPSAPQSVSVGPKALTAGYLTVTWAAPASLNGGTLSSYYVFCGATSGNRTQVGSTSLLTLDVNVGAASTARYCTVVAVTDGGWGSNSTEASGQTYAVPNAPTGLAAVPTTGHKMTLTWVAPITSDLPVTSYKLYRSSTGSGNEVYLTTVTGATTYLDSGLTAALTYYYKVTAVSSAGESAMSSEASGTAV